MRVEITEQQHRLLIEYIVDKYLRRRRWRRWRNERRNNP